MKILISVALALLFAGCSSDTKQEAETVKQEASVKEEVAAKAELPVVAEAPKDEVVATVETVKGEVVAKVEEVKEAASAQVSGATLYQVCAGCHGADASKAALGKSQIIKGWDAKKIAAALHGYKAGTYGAAMKSVMAGQVSKLSDEDIKILSEHISKL